jgi:hypothetical protein
MAEMSASLPALQKKILQLMAIRYHIVCASQLTHPDVHPTKRLPMPTYTKLMRCRAVGIDDRKIGSSSLNRDP